MKAIYQSISGRRNIAILLINVGNVALYRGKPGYALDLYRTALRDFSVTGDRINESNVLNSIGCALSDSERYDEALSHHRRALAIAEEIDNRYEKTRATLGVANVDAGLGRFSSALRNYRKSCGIAGDIGDPYLEALALSGIASATNHSDGTAAARIYWRQARDIFQRLGTVSDLASVEIRHQALEFTSTSPTCTFTMLGGPARILSSATQARAVARFRRRVNGPCPSECASGATTESSQTPGREPTSGMSMRVSLDRVLVSSSTITSPSPPS
jgi:tetratricopeptide (TPR) repeat protein